MEPTRNVLDTVELLEAIMLNLDMKTLLLSQRVNKQFQATIQNSPKLQEKLYFRPIPVPFDGRPLQWVCNPLLKSHIIRLDDPSTTILPYLRSHIEISDCNPDGIVIQVKGCETAFKKLTDRTLDNTGSWKNMLIVQPVVKPYGREAGELDPDNGLVHDPSNGGEHKQTGTPGSCLYRARKLPNTRGGSEEKQVTMDCAPARTRKEEKWKGWVCDADGKWIKVKALEDMDWADRASVWYLNVWRFNTLQECGWQQPFWQRLDGSLKNAEPAGEARVVLALVGATGQDTLFTIEPSARIAITLGRQVAIVKNWHA